VASLHTRFLDWNGRHARLDLPHRCRVVRLQLRERQSRAHVKSESKTAQAQREFLMTLFVPLCFCDEALMLVAMPVLPVAPAILDAERMCRLVQTQQDFQTQLDVIAHERKDLRGLHALIMRPGGRRRFRFIKRKLLLFCRLHPSFIRTRFSSCVLGHSAGQSEPPVTQVAVIAQQPVHADESERQRRRLITAPHARASTFRTV
jgi:hypothetical protein